MNLAEFYRDNPLLIEQKIGDGTGSILGPFTMRGGAWCLPVEIMAGSPITGTVSVSNFPSSYPVTGTFWQATQPVSGPLTNAELRALAVPISGSVSILGTVPVSGTFFQATQPVSIATMPTTPVTGTFFQATQPISAVSLPLPTGAATETTLADIELDLDQFTFSSTRLLVDGSGVTQPVSGTITATFPTSTTPTLSNVAGSASSVTILAANANRRIATVFNDSTSTLYLKYGSSASTSSFTVLLTANAYYELPQPVYTGIITGIWLVATGNARVTEVV